VRGTDWREVREGVGGGVVGEVCAEEQRADVVEAQTEVLQLWEQTSDPRAEMFISRHILVVASRVEFQVRAGWRQGGKECCERRPGKPEV